MYAYFDNAPIVYGGCNISMCYPSGYYESYVDGTFVVRETLADMYVVIEESDDYMEWFASELF